MITLLTEWLYIAAQMPHGTHAQQNVFRAAQRAGTPRLGAGRAGPRREAARRASCATAASATAIEPLPSEEHFDAVVREEAERQAPRAAAARARLAAARSIPSRPWSRAATPPSTRSRPSPRSSRTSAGQRGATGSSSPTPTSRWPTCAAARRPRPATGTPAPGSTSPTSARARPTPATCATPGRGPRSLIDDDEPQPRLLEMLADLNPLQRRRRAAEPRDSARHRGLAGRLRRPDPDPRPAPAIGSSSTARSATTPKTTRTTTPRLTRADERPVSPGPPYLMKSISSYFGSGQRSSATTFSSLSAASRTSAHRRQLLVAGVDRAARGPRCSSG